MPDSKSGHHRTHLTLQALHTFTRSLWISRNDMLHKQTETSDSLKYFTKSAEIRQYFADPLLLPAEDRHYVSDSLNNLLRSRPSVRRRWLRRVRASRASMIKHRESQLTINEFFKPQRQDPATEHRHDTPVPPHDTTTTDSNNTQPPPTQPIERAPWRPPDTAIQETLTRHRTNTSYSTTNDCVFPRPTSRPTSDPPLQHPEILRTSENRTELRSGTSCDPAKSLYHR